MPARLDAVKTKKTRPDWYQDVVKYQQPHSGKAIWQLVNTLIPYAILLVLMARSVQLEMSYGITLALAIVAVGFLVRVFIIFHDCGHGSFLASRRARTILGYVTGILTFTPYEQWRYAHAVHHATVGDLDRRGTGDVYIMTVDEYLAAPRWKRIAYRFYEHPLVMFGLGPVFVFLIRQRFSPRGAKPQHRRSVHATNLALLVIVVAASLTIGFRTYVLVQLPIILVAGAAGVWLFYVQHHFEGAYWARHEAWDPWQAALQGSSFYKLPKVLQWFTGNIGLHHIHHAGSRIPNYNLQQCYDEVLAMQTVQPLTFWESLKTVRFDLYDEKQRKLVSFGALKTFVQQG